VSAKRAPRVILNPNPDPAGDLLSHGMAMVAVPVILGLLGHWLDGRLGTGPGLVIAFAAFGLAGAFFSAYFRYEERIAQHDEGKPWTRRATR
jgi:positive regulator of sigma E activity